MEVTLAHDAFSAMLAAAAARHPHEACGLLFGTAAAITGFCETANAAADPTRHFEVDPAALIAAHRAARGSGPHVIGYFHSHPTGDPAPSATDRAAAAHDGRIWAIAGGGTIALWRDAPSGFEALSYRLVGG